MSAPEPATKDGSIELLDKLRRAAVGLDAEYLLATGERTRRIYLDSTATTLRLKVVQDTLERYQPYYANTHSLLHFGAKLSTREYAWAHEMVLDFVGALVTIAPFAASLPIRTRRLSSRATPTATPDVETAVSA